MEESIVLHLVLGHIEKFAEILILHLFAFSMEVEPDQLEAGVCDGIVHFLKVVSQTFLRPLFVNQIDKCAVLECRFDIIVVFLGNFAVVFIVRVDVHFWPPFEIWILVPKKRHQASKLNIREDILFASTFCQKYNFSFSCIGGIPIQVCSSGKPSFTLSSLVSSRNQGNFTSVVYTCMREVDRYKT